MKNYQPDTYGEYIAEPYDRLYPSVDKACVDFLSGLSRNGRVLELGIGTGRIALPLRERGIDIEGIEASPAMISQLKAKPGGSAIPVTIGDFSSFQVNGTFDMVFVAFNTFFCLTTQEFQLKCMKSVRAHLKADGCLVIEAFVPDVGRFDGGQVVRAIKVETNEVQLQVSLHDAKLQQIDSQLVQITTEGIKMYPVLLRYAWPSELDAMAEASGMKLKERWQDWERTPFSSASTKHISVYVRNGG